jgi:hypothetical protein
MAEFYRQSLNTTLACAVPKPLAKLSGLIPSQVTVLIYDDRRRCWIGRYDTLVIKLPQCNYPSIILHLKFWVLYLCDAVFRPCVSIARYIISLVKVSWSWLNKITEGHGGAELVEELILTGQSLDSTYPVICCLVSQTL